MFGSVSDLILKASNPPYKVATSQGGLVFSNLTGAVLAIIKSQQASPNTNALRRVVEVDHNFDAPNCDVDGDGTFNSDESADALDSLMNGQMRPRQTSFNPNARSIGGWSANGMIIDDMSLEPSTLCQTSFNPNARSIGGWPANGMIIDDMSLEPSTLRQPLGSVPSRGRSSSTERAHQSDLVAMHQLLDSMLEAHRMSQAVNASVYIDQFAQLMRRMWNYIDKTQAAGLSLKIRALFAPSPQLVFSGLHTNILRKWLYTVIINLAVNTDMGIQILQGMISDFQNEKVYWQQLLAEGNHQYRSSEERANAQHIMADTINHITFNLEQLEQLRVYNNLESVRRFAAALVTNDRIHFIEDSFFNWIHGHTSDQGVMRSMCSLLVCSRIPRESFGVSGVLEITYRNLMSRRVAIPLLMMMKSHMRLSEKVKMRITFGIGLDDLAFSCNAIGRNTGEILIAALRQIILSPDTQTQERIWDMVFRDMMVSTQRHNDSHITRIHNPQ